jgi:predicted Rossmann fold flavoprotein
LLECDYKTPMNTRAKNTIYDVIIVGGGASGMMAAGSAGAMGKKVLLIEKNKNLGEKLKITGGGRCNITNAEYDEHALLSHYGEANQYLYSPFSQFGVKDTFSFFKNLDLDIVVEARKRAFPATQKAIDVYNAMATFVEKNNVEIITNSPIVKIHTEKNLIQYVGDKNGKRYHAKNYIFATGGYSKPETGSTGDGFHWLSDLGHTVHKPTPSIVPLQTKEPWVVDISGVSLSFMKITFFVDNKKAFAKKGKILFTHFGLSSPLILNSSKQVGDLLHTGEVTASIDMYPDTDIGSLDKQLIKTFDQNKNKSFKNIAKEITPAGMHALVIKLLSEQFDTDKKVHSITKEERRMIIDLLKGLQITIVGLMGFDRAVIADGGIPMSEIDTRTMQSKKVSNLFVTGDLLHVNRPSGGYSLQLCWTTGFVAGKSASV